MLRLDLNNKVETMCADRERVQQSDALGEYALAECLREIPVQEQEHQIDRATALGTQPVEVAGRNSAPARKADADHVGSTLPPNRVLIEPCGKKTAVIQAENRFGTNRALDIPVKGPNRR